MVNFNEYGAPGNFLSDPQASARVIEEVQQDQYSNQLDEIEEELSEEEALFEEMSEVEVRLEEANCYKALLNGQLFAQRTPISKRVEGKIRDYIKQQLRILVGLDVPKVTPGYSNTYKSPFTPEEENRLKTLAQKMIERENANNNGPVLNKPAEMPKPQATQQAVNPVYMEETKSEPKITNKVVKRVKATQTKESIKPKKDDKIKVEINGQVVETSVRSQTLPPNAAPKMTRQQIADIQAQQAEKQVFHSQPKGGIMSVAIAQAMEIAKKE